MLKALKGLTESRKATMLVILFLAMAALVYAGKLEVDKFISTVESLTGIWLGAHAVEEGAKAGAKALSNGNGKFDPMAALSAVAKLLSGKGDRGRTEAPVVVAQDDPDVEVDEVDEES